jgi:uncharacterized membrane protein YphA (DoxX/SURF4 family)
MDLSRYRPYESLILRAGLGFTMLFWGYEKLTVSKLAEAYSKDYGPFMIMDVKLFLILVGIIQIILAVMMIMGLFTRLTAGVLALMALVTILVPGAVILRDVPHFAYAFAAAGGALVLVIKGGGPYSLDEGLARTMWDRS